MLHLLPHHRKNENQIAKLITPRTITKLSCMEVHNQAFKEDTFIQMGRRGGVAEMGAQAVLLSQTSAEAAEAVEWTGGIPQSKKSQPQARLQSPGFRHQEDRFPLPLAIKTSGSCGSIRNSQIFTTLLKGPAQSQNICKITHSRIHHWGSSWKSTSHTWEGGEVTGNWASAGQNARSQAMALSPLQALPTQPQSSEVGALPWQLPKAPPHIIYR